MDGESLLGENFFGAVLSALSDGLAAVDGGGHVHYLNGRAKELIGVPVAEEFPILLRRYSPEIFMHLRRCLRGSTAEIFEVQINYPERRLLRVSCLPMPAAGTIPMHALVMTDRTEEEDGNDRRRDDDACAAVELIAGTLAHELGNALNSVQIHLQLLARQLHQLSKSGKAAETVVICRGEAERMHRLLSNFLGAIRPAKVVMQPLDLNEVLKNCLAVQAAELSQRNIAVAVDFCREPPIILGDEERLQQVFFNLLRNGMEAIEGSGTVELRTANEGAFVRVEICDSGVGIDQSAMANLFRPQWSGKREGNGLGLLVVRRILRAHRSTMAVGSASPSGTRITLRFPLKDPKFPMLAGLGDGGEVFALECADGEAADPGQWNSSACQR
ncbi:MAG: PAS domain-containing protein [Puniceicoccales bacterium]|nr:PAS domain-containing protein [Puniceicoccales bacterium]